MFLNKYVYTHLRIVNSTLGFVRLLFISLYAAKKYLLYSSL